MEKIIACFLLFLVFCLLIVPAFAAESPLVRYGLYDDHFVFEGVSYSFSSPGDDLVPAFMYLVGDELSIVFRNTDASPYVLIAGDGKLTYFDENLSTMLKYSLSESSLTYQRTVSANRIDAISVDIDQFRSCFLVSLHDISFYRSFNGGGVFRSAEAEVFYEDVTDDPEYNGDITDFFASLFGGLASMFEVEPMLYLFGILILAFIIFIIKMIIRH